MRTMARTIVDYMKTLDYTWEENDQFLEFLRKNGVTICYNLRQYRGHWQALLYGPGKFYPKWHDIPDESLPDDIKPKENDEQASNSR